MFVISLMLTKRELEITLRRASGESQRDIATALKITQGAVCQFEKNAEKKLIDATDIIEFLANKGVKVTDSTYGREVVHGGKK